MANISTGLIYGTLIPGVQAIYGLGKDYGDQAEAIYGPAIKSEKYQEYDIEMQYLGAATFKPEGAPGGSDIMQQKYQNTYVHRVIQNTYGITREAFSDNQYKSEFPLKTLALKQSLTMAKNIMAASILNNAFNPAAPLGDGLPACAANRPVSGGTYSNAPTGDATVDFSEAGLEDGLITIQQFRSQSNILVHVMGDKAILPRNDQFAAIRILKSTYQAETANNAVTAIKEDGYLPGGFTVNQYLTGKAWFIKTNADNGLKHFQREGVQFDSYYDFPSATVMVQANERLSFGISNPRALYGSPGA